MNTIVLMGRLARDPETKLTSTQKGQTKVSRFPLVVKRKKEESDGFQTAEKRKIPFDIPEELEQEMPFR